ncbi:ArnT family glycosyltransferase [Aestuariivivens sediminicola]|uniref:ArnT family glycosyltransferase n=1 Tax=Aestuariivivens sediminicola TaxID=2913560 RepID=UPI001F582DF4|nr:glycosyltransferase family 39 protein [Aestuariivivens sediminicola]
MKRSNTFLLINPITLFLFLALVLSITALYPYMRYDEGLWTYIGRIWVDNGMPPYVGSVENKTPGIFILYALSEIVSNGNFYFVRMIGALSVLISSVFIYKTVKQLYDKFAGILAMCIFGLVFCWFVFDGSALAQTETFMILFSVLGFYAIVMSAKYPNLNTLMYISGLALGLAISFKQISITTYIAFSCFYFIYLNPQRTKRKLVSGYVCFVLGIVSILVSSVFILDVFFAIPYQDYLEGSWAILTNSGSKAPTIKMRFIKFLDVFVFSKIIIFYPLLVVVFYNFKLILNTFLIGVMLWLIIDFFGVNSSGYYYGHQLRQVIAPLSILLGCSIATLLDKGLFPKYFNYKKVLILVIFLFFPYYQVLYSGFQYINRDTAVYELIGRWLNDNTSDKDYVYILGADENLIKGLAISESVSSSKYFNSIFLSGEMQNEELYQDLISNPPVFILKEIDVPIDINVYSKKNIDYVENNYTDYENIGNCQILKRNR